MDEGMHETPVEAIPEEKQSTDAGTYITVPPNFQPPEDKQMGQEFEGTFTGHLTEDGRLCLTAINQIPLTGTETPPDASEGDMGGETEDDTEKASAAPSNAQDEGGALIESTPEIKESKKLKSLLRG